MKKPKKPNPPKIPEEPEEPKKILKGDVNIGYIDLVWGDSTLFSLYDSFRDFLGREPTEEDMKLAHIDIETHEGYYGYTEHDQKFYVKNWEYKNTAYPAQLARYKKSLTSYHKKLKEYNIKKEQYDQDMKKYQEWLDKEQERKDKKLYEKLKRKYGKE